MNRKVLLIQGGGEGGYEADLALVASLQAALGKEYDIIYPEIQSDEAAPDFGWLQQIGKNISDAKSPLVLAGHSFGASIMLKYLSENDVQKSIAGIFLMATPFWRGEEDWMQGLQLKANFAEQLPERVPVFLYHCRDDAEIPFEHLALYRQKLPHAVMREIESGGHQFNHGLSMVAKDISSL